MNRPEINFKSARRKASKFLILCFFASLWSISAIRADYATTEFERGNKLFDQGKYADAIAAYDNLITNDTVSPAVLFNRGNAFFKLNQTGKAIASFLQAEKLSPRDPDIRANLQVARNQVGGNGLPSPRWKIWVNKLSLNEWTKLALVSFWILFILLALVQWRTELKRSLNRFIFALVGIVLLLGVCLGLSAADFYSTKIAIVSTKETVVRVSPLETGQTAFPARDGMELRVLDSENDWLLVNDGRRGGWLKRDAVLIFEPSAKKAKT